MPIHLITGIPGHGKTANAVKLLLEANERNAALIAKGEPPRPLYACGIDGLADGLAEPLDDAANWKDCPDGSLIFVDEAWKWFGHLHDARGKPTPPHVLDLAEHRHRGMDFVWTAQGPGQLYPFVRPLIDQHWHCVRRFGTQLVDIYKWGELVEEVKSQGMRDRAEKSPSTLPTKTFESYKSASVHTIKPRLPWKLWVIPVVVVLAVFAGYFAWKSLNPAAMASNAKAPEAGLPADGANSLEYNPTGNSKKQPLTAEAWLERLTPRFPGLHESAPVFDEREVLAVPRRFCIISGEGRDQRCSCYTEQGTPLRLVQPGVCLELARWGEYDHFRAPPEPGKANPVFQPDQVAPVVPTGSQATPTAVGSPSMGQVQGRAPATLRASGN